MLTCHVSVHHIWACSNESRRFHGLSNTSWNNHFPTCLRASWECLSFKGLCGKETAVNSLWLQQWEWAGIRHLILFVSLLQHSSGSGGRVPCSLFSSIERKSKWIAMTCSRVVKEPSVSQQSDHKAQQYPCGKSQGNMYGRFRGKLNTGHFPSVYEIKRGASLSSLSGTFLALATMHLWSPSQWTADCCQQRGMVGYYNQI